MTKDERLKKDKSARQAAIAWYGMGRIILKVLSPREVLKHILKKANDFVPPVDTSNYFWQSSLKGTYRKPKETNENSPA